jgi:hypothetical protein
MTGTKGFVALAARTFSCLDLGVNVGIFLMQRNE